MDALRASLVFAKFSFELTYLSMTSTRPPGSRTPDRCVSHVFQRCRVTSPNLDSRTRQPKQPTAVIVDCRRASSQAISSQPWDAAFPQSVNSWKQVLPRQGVIL